MSPHPRQHFDWFSCFSWLTLMARDADRPCSMCSKQCAVHCCIAMQPNDINDPANVYSTVLVAVLITLVTHFINWMWTQFYLAVSPPVGCYCHHTAQKLVLVFTARCYASAVLAMACVCLSITSQSSTKTAKRRITQTTPHDSPGTLVFWCQRSLRNSTRITACGGAKYRWGGSKSSTFHK